MQFTKVKHEIGKISKCAVLDIGLKCPHSCEFCYYSFLDGTEDQFRGVREAPFRPLSECKKALDFFVSQGFERLDITGGEPLYHPDVVEIVRYAEKEKNLRVRMITLGQLFHKEDKWTGKKLWNALIEDAEISEFLFSFHSVDPNLFRKITKGSFSKLEQSMDKLDEMGFEYCTNTVVYANNAQHMPDLARYIIKKKRRIHICNFITMNTYFSWSTGRAFGVQARYRDIVKPLKEAVDILEDAGIGVNVRYGPYCVLKGLEKNLVGCVGVLFDPYEWRNSTRKLFEVMAYNEKEAYENRVKQLPLNNKVFPSKCDSCSVIAICDGIDESYLKKYGDEEFEAYNGPSITDVVHFRRQNPKVFLLKQKVGEDGTLQLPVKSDMPSETAGLFGKIRNLYDGMGKFFANRMYRNIYLAEVSIHNSSKGHASWADATELTGEANQLLIMEPGSFVAFNVTFPADAMFSSKICLLSDKNNILAKAPAGIRLSISVKVDDSDEQVVWRSGSSNSWKQVKLPLAKWGDKKVDFSISCLGEAGEQGLKVALLEPRVTTKKPFIHILKILYRSLRYNGIRVSYRKLKNYAYYSARDVQID